MAFKLWPSRSTSDITHLFQPGKLCYLCSDKPHNMAMQRLCNIIMCIVLLCITPVMGAGVTVGHCHHSGHSFVLLPAHDMPCARDCHTPSHGQPDVTAGCMTYVLHRVVPQVVRGGSVTPASPEFTLQPCCVPAVSNHLPTIAAESRLRRLEEANPSSPPPTERLHMLCRLLI